MPDAHWENLKQIFHAASALPLNERDAYVDKACKGDLALRSAVAGLLKSHEETGNFIDSPAFQAAAEMLASRGQLKAGQIAKVLTVSPGTARARLDLRTRVVKPALALLPMGRPIAASRFLGW